MRTDLDHLPPAKQRELERVVQILFEEFEEKIALATQDWKRKGRIQKIILYGSYARGNWVDEPHTAKGYQSDFDLLIIVTDAETPWGEAPKVPKVVVVNVGTYPAPPWPCRHIRVVPGER